MVIKQKQLYKGWSYPTDNQPISYVDGDGYTWYRLDCKYQFGDWIEQHSPKLWRCDNPYHMAHYWVHEKLFGLILLKGA